MKTRQIQNPIDTPLRFQRTDDNFFNGTALLNQWNHTHFGNEQREMSGYLRIKSTKEYANFLQERYNIKNAIIKSRLGTWMHPHLFIDFAMWISLEFKDMAIKWVLDGLMQERNDAGDYANLLQATIMERYIEYNGCKPNPMIYQNEFRLLKNLSNIDDRNLATEKQLKTLNTLQLLDIQLIKDKVGKISREKQLIQLAKALN